ncbi:MAG: TolC family protein [Acidobacteriota bacterium]
MLALRRFSLVILGVALWCGAAFGQQSTDYSKPKAPMFTLKQYTPWSVPQPNFVNAPRLDQLIKNGELRLSMSDAILLALENNLDLAIQRYNLKIADTDLLLSKAGSSPRGVSTGVVSGTPGGGVGGFGAGASGSGAGGTSTGAGGAGAGAGGLVTSTIGGGAAVPQFDPVLTSTLQFERANTPLSNIRTTGTQLLNQNSMVANFSYSQGFATGTNMSVSFNNSRTTNNSLFSILNPALNSSFRLTLSQHLLSGFGIANNRRSITLAKNNREISDIAFRQQVISTVTQIQNIYWDLVNAYEDLRVQQESLALAEKTLADNQKQVEIGTLAPIEVVRAQSEVAARQQSLIVSQTNLQLQQLLMKNAVSRNMTDPTLATVPVIPTDTMSLPATEPIVPTEDLINDALNHRPELAQAQIDLNNRDISKKALRNALLPSLDVFAFYGGTGLGGTQDPSLVCGAPGAPEPPNCNIAFPGGYGGVLPRLFNSSAPDKGAGVSLSIPLRNRAAQATQVRSELEYRQAQMRIQQLQNQIRIQVRNAQFTVQQDRAAVEAARKAVELQRQNLDAEQKKYALGASTNILVLQAQRDLTQASSNLVQAMSAYEKAKVSLDQITGLTLSHLGIDLAEAEAGSVQKSPNVPGVVPRPEGDQQPKVISPTEQ